MVITSINRISYVFFFVLLSSCSCDHFLTKDSGLRSKKLYHQYISKRINPEIINIETSVVYESLRIFYNEETKKMDRIKTKYLSDEDSFLHFYEDGTVYRFQIKKKGFYK